MTVTTRRKARPVSREVADNRPSFTGRARPKYVNRELNVYDAALARIEWLFDEFDDRVCVSNSGGKDSTVTLELAALVNNRRGRKRGPLRVHWLDQECEFGTTVEYQRYLAYERDDIDFRWYQVPFLLENSSSHEHEWAHVWDPALAIDPTAPQQTGWMRPKEPPSPHVITENTYGQQYFVELLAAISSQDWQGCILDGIRAEESPARRLTTTSSPMYKWTTWSAVDADPATARDPSTHRFRFHPVYDWTFRDVWKAIHDNNWRYNRHYDHLFQYGVPLRNMRVSNFHHESALGSLVYLQEVEPDTWENATRRLTGISTYGHLTKDQYPTSLPYMFSSWVEYMEYLIDNLITTDDKRRLFRRHWRRLHNGLLSVPVDELAQVMITSIIGNDFYGVKVDNYMVSKRKFKPDPAAPPPPPRTLIEKDWTPSPVQAPTSAVVTGQQRTEEAQPA